LQLLLPLHGVYIVNDILDYEASAMLDEVHLVGRERAEV
jgi:hypothetical protein